MAQSRISVESIRTNLKHDLGSGLVVFLVALPLCMGIALASNAPIISGLITGIIAGLLVSILSGSELSVSGPAAGLTVIVASAIAQLGSFEIFLSAVLVGGLIQIVFGIIRAGALSTFIPNSVIHGMMAAIGVTIILKQIPHALGRDTDYEGNLNFQNLTDHENTFSELLLAFESISPVAVFIALCGIGLLVYWPELQSKMKLLESIPGVLAAVLFGIGANEAVGIFAPALQLGASHLVEIPATGGVSFLWSSFNVPSWELLTSPAVLKVGVVLALVGSIESLLSVEAADKLDPEGRVSAPNRELVAQGIGNTICGLLGGIPMTSVIIRTSANIYSGAKSRVSGFIHGLLLLISVVLLSSLMNRIPLAALAAVLTVVGYKLTSITVIRRVLGTGLEQFIPFIATLIAVMLTDLLTGVAIGFCVSLLVLVMTSVQGAIVAVKDGSNIFIQFTKDVSFSNKAFLRKLLQQVPDDSTVFIDGTRAMFIDHDIYEMLEDFKTRAKSRNIDVELLEVAGKNYHLVHRKRKKIYEEVPKPLTAIK